jgi:hypothetical protein
MRTILSFAIILAITLWFILTVFVIIALLDKNFNPGFKSISQIDFRNYLKLSLISVAVLSILLLLKKYFFKK